METEIPEKNEEDMAPTDLEWQQRVLCSDGNCIGVIGSDGHCKECGKEYEGSLAEAGLPENEESSAAENFIEENSLEKEAPSPDDMPHEAAEQDDWQNRVLCSDGNCIGVIGPDGRCKECGKPFRMTNDE